MKIKITRIETYTEIFDLDVDSVNEVQRWLDEYTEEAEDLHEDLEYDTCTTIAEEVKE